MKDQDRKLHGVRKLDNAIILMSGGLDSTTVLSFAKKNGYNITGLSFDYGQRHRRELESSKKIADFYGIQRLVFKIDLRQIGGSSLTGDEAVEIGKLERKEIPNTYVPGRNILFLSIAAAYSELLDARTIMMGVNSVDYSGYPDCRPNFISSMEQSLQHGLDRSDLKIMAPLQYLNKGEIITMGIKNNAPYELTYSCYNGREKACGRCDSCLLRLRGFMDAGEIDPTPYETYPHFYIDYLRNSKKYKK